MAVPKKKKNLIRPDAPWGEHLGSSATKPQEIPKEGWAFVSGKHAAECGLYYCGHEVKYVRNMEHKISAGELATLHLEIIMPELTYIRRDKSDEPVS